MGFFGSLLGWDQSMGAVNAVLASHLIQHSNNLERKKIAQEVVRIIKAIQARQTPEQIAKSLSSEVRPIQMNFVALSCDNLGIDPPVPGNVWTRVDNPYRVGRQIDQGQIDNAIHAVAVQDMARVKWPGNNVKVDFLKLLGDGTLVER